eukprot:jgi/Ulvmu1/10215/UM060_0015.1
MRLAIIVITCASRLVGSIAGATESRMDGIDKCPDCDRIPYASVSPCTVGLVCGSDQHTYGSSCLALCQGIQVARMHSCDHIEGRCTGSDPEVHLQQATDLGFGTNFSTFTRQDLTQFSGFRLLGKINDGAADRRNPARAYVAADHEDMGGNRGASCSVIRIDHTGNKYARPCSKLSPAAHGTTPGETPQQISVVDGFKPAFDTLSDATRYKQWTASARSAARPARLRGLAVGDMSLPKDHARDLLAIIGDDNRHPVDSSMYPYTAIGQLRYKEAGSGAAYLCTGTLFSERHVITNAHCVYNKDLRKFHSGWEFSPGLAGDEQPFGTVKYAFYDIYTAAYEADFKNWDVAIVTLQEPVGLQAGWMGVKALPPAGTCSSRSVLLPNLHAVGYPVEESVSDHAFGDACDLYVRNGCDHSASSHKCDTKVGNSGSPLFEASDVNRTKWLIRAVHFAGLRNSEYNLAIPIDDMLFKWMECYRTGQPECAANVMLA